MPRLTDRTSTPALRLPPIVIAVAIQITAMLLTILLVRVANIRLNPWLLAVACGVLAASATRLARLERWWVAMQLLLPPLLLAMLYLDWPPWVYLIAFALLALNYTATMRTRVPLYLSNAQTWQAIEALLPRRESQPAARFLDLGSGLGGLLCYLSARRPDMQFVGIELAPLPALYSRLRGWLTGRRNLQIHWGSFWKHDLAEFDVVFAFLSPVPMPELWRKAQREMRPGSLFISCAFEVPGQTPDHVVELAAPRQPRLLVWRMSQR